jgi:Resolvase, N terminal domain
MAKHSGKWISYLRVSTDKQGASGLGIEAQRHAVLDYLNGGRWTLSQEFIEVESGKRSDRPQLAAALAACKKQKAKLVIAKLDRLARNVAFHQPAMTPFPHPVKVTKQYQPPYLFPRVSQTSSTSGSRPTGTKTPNQASRRTRL